MTLKCAILASTYYLSTKQPSTNIDFLSPKNLYFLCFPETYHPFPQPFFLTDSKSHQTILKDSWVLTLQIY